MFDAFWRATGEPPFQDLTLACAACYRLIVETSRPDHRADHRVYRVERTASGAATFVAHVFKGYDPGLKEASARTHEIALDESLWTALDVLLAVSRFWELPEENSRWGLDGASFTLEGWKVGHSHRVVRWSPSIVFSGGELLAVVTDYLERLGELAILECDPEIRMRYATEYVPKRQRAAKSNMS